MTKPLAAVIIKEIKRQGHSEPFPDEFCVCPEAVKNELKNTYKTREYANELYPDMSKQFTERKRDFYRFYSEKFVKFTLVSHLVWQHLDVFANNLPLLEN